MKKRFMGVVAVAAALALCVFVLAACGGNNNNSSSSSGDNASAGTSTGTTETLIVGFDSGYPPYGFIGDDGEYTGVDIDLAREAASRLGMDVQFEPIDWDAKDALLNQGTINCIWNGFTMEGREDDYTFSDPYMLNEQVVVVKADSGIKGIEDLEGKHVMTQMDSAALDVLEGDMADIKDTFADLQTIGDYNNAFMQLESGAVDAVACDLSVAEYQMAANPGTYEQVEPPLSSEHYAVGFKKGDTEIAQKISETLLDMYNDGAVEKILDKYSDYGVTVENWVLVDAAGNAD